MAELERADAVDLGSRLKAARRAAGLTQPQLVEGFISVTYISRIERGERRPGPDLLEQLCHKLNVSARSIISGFDAIDTRQLELELEYAELSLSTGDADTALTAAVRLASTQAVAADSAMLARATLLRADALAALGETTDAVTTYEECLRAHPSGAHWPSAAIALSRLLREVGDLRRSAAVAEGALERLASTELHGGEEAIRLSVTLAATLYELGEVGRSVLLCQQAISSADELGSDRARAAAYWNSSVIEAEAGNIDRALELARTALVLLEGRDDTRSLARLCTQLGEILLRTDPADVDTAIAYLERAAEDYRWGNASEAERLHNQVTLARARYLAGDVASAIETATAVVDTVQDLPFVSAAAAILLGQTSFAAGRQDEARTHYLRAIHEVTSVGADRQAVQLWFDLASLLDEAGMTADANDAYRRAAASSGYSSRPNPFLTAKVRQSRSESPTP